jgi:hypothetical protein
MSLRLASPNSAVNNTVSDTNLGSGLAFFQKSANLHGGSAKTAAHIDSGDPHITSLRGC